MNSRGSGCLERLPTALVFPLDSSSSSSKETRLRAVVLAPGPGDDLRPVRLRALAGDDGADLSRVRVGVRGRVNGDGSSCGWVSRSVSEPE
jgi:hypothetical protein